jgi:catechol 2,3-dioxygenase-like lactoylglutathione lyase family enzyme
VTGEQQGEPRRLRIAGLHHVTVICRDVERSVGFYRNLLGMRLVTQTSNADDQGARHLYFGDERGRPGTLVTCLEYPQLEEGRVGVGSTHHFALAVDSEEELQGWRDYLSSRGVPCTEVLDRELYRSVYLRDPDGHIVELAAGGDWPSDPPPPTS